MQNPKFLACVGFVPNSIETHKSPVCWLLFVYLKAAMSNSLLLFYYHHSSSILMYTASGSTETSFFDPLRHTSI
jgi:hypothetical protein